jgi:uncharacterized membrane protein
MTHTWNGLLRGAAAGAAGTTALNAATQLDATLRGRPGSDVPARVVGGLADRAGVPVPGDRRTRARRLAGAGPLAGTLTGVALGAAAGVLRTAGLRLPTAVGGPLLGAAAMLATDGPATVLGVTDPRRWSATDWAADVVPHLVYGVTTHAALASAVPAAEAARARPPAGVLARAAALGAATGSRSSAGVAALALSSRRSDPGPVLSRLGGRGGTVVACGLAVGEAVLDKLPATPARTSPQALVPRAALGAATAAGAARRDGHDGTLAGAVGLAAALVTSVLAVRARAAASARFGSDLPGALAEDALCAALARLGARRA